MQTVIRIIEEALRQAFLIFLAAGCVVSLVIGVWLLVQPQAIIRLNQYFNKWFGTEKFTLALDNLHHIEHALYRHHRLFGFLVLASGAYILYVLTFSFSKKAAVSFFARGMNIHAAAWLMDALVVVLFLAGVCAVVIGGFLIIRPSLLRNFEQKLNSWYATEKRLQVLDTARYDTDAWVARNARILGVIITVGSAYAIAFLWKVLL
ncbi:MAG TPA: hypothetical protein VHE58_01460 [Burkholderiales bacterium]|nr:hypothetical protein [Burkholderiales bacterium]